MRDRAYRFIFFFCSNVQTGDKISPIEKIYHDIVSMSKARQWQVVGGLSRSNNLPSFHNYM